jgi:hypothetical protein
MIPSFHKSFTTTYPGKSRTLINEIQVTHAFDLNKNPALTGITLRPYLGLWDTGATASVITQKIVDECSLHPIGFTNVFHAHGQQQAEVYLINIFLPNKVAFSALKVTKGDLTGADMLIGMDVIGQGDFCVTNFNNETVFTFRIPSAERIDFVKHPKALHPPELVKSAPKIGRNDDCPCGSGKKYKKCCEGRNTTLPHIG